MVSIQSGSYVPKTPTANGTAADAGAGFAALDAILRGMDLAELIPWARQQFINGASVDQVTMGLRQQDVFRQRYSVIFEREQQGLTPITVADVVNYRRRAAELATMYGMPRDFIDVNKLMLADVSMEELSGRVQAASMYVDTRPDVTEQMQALYGLDRGAAIAFVLDPATGEQAVQRTWQSAQVSSQALRQGFGQLSRAEAEQLAGLGVTEAQASQRFAQIAQAGELTKTLEGETAQFNRQDSLDFAAGNAPAQQKLARRQQERTAVFSEGGGFASDRRGMVGLGSADM